MAMLGKNQTIVTEFLLLGFQTLHSFKILLFTVFLVTYIMTISSNLLIITLVSTSHKLNSPMYFFLAHLSLSDILLTMVIVPNMLRLIWGEGGTMSVAGCISQLHFFAYSVAAESLLLTVMSYDRYLAICHPLHYTTIMNFKFCLQLVIWSWLLGFVVTLILVLPISQLQFCVPNVIDHFFCDLTPLLKHSGHSFNINKVLSLLFTVVTPFFNPIIYSLRNKEIGEALRRRFHYSTDFWHERRGR
ncbi:hypothetical protein FKM82_007379 [Ascaphus truei]